MNDISNGYISDDITDSGYGGTQTSGGQDSNSNIEANHSTFGKGGNNIIDATSGGGKMLFKLM